MCVHVCSWTCACLCMKGSVEKQSSMSGRTGTPLELVTVPSAFLHSPFGGKSEHTCPCKWHDTQLQIMLLASDLFTGLILEMKHLAVLANYNSELK